MFSRAEIQLSCICVTMYLCICIYVFALLCICICVFVYLRYCVFFILCLCCNYFSSSCSEMFSNSKFSDFYLFSPTVNASVNASVFQCPPLKLLVGSLIPRLRVLSAVRATDFTRSECHNYLLKFLPQ